MKPMQTGSSPVFPDPTPISARHTASNHARGARHVAAMFATALFLGACANAGADYRPVVDMHGHSDTAYDRDIAACQQTARTARNGTKQAENAGLGAAGGAAGGAVLGAIGGDALLGAGV